MKRKNASQATVMTKICVISELEFSRRHKDHQHRRVIFSILDMLA
jgi:hypothetical protein